MDLCTVVSEKFIPQALNLIKSYQINSFDNKVFLYYFNTEKEKLKIFEETFPDKVILREVPNLFGHCLDPKVFFYKVYAINDCLINNSKSVIYSDSSNCFVRKTETLEQDLIDDSLFMMYQHPALSNQYWTTNKCFEKMESEPSRNSPQYWAGFQAYKRSEQNINFVTELYEYMKDPEIALPDMMLKRPDGPDAKCVEHRCDQSVLSILIDKHDRHHFYDMNKNDKYGDWQTIVHFDKSFVPNFKKTVLSPRELKYVIIRYLNL